jgi:hypothetical protein
MRMWEISTRLNKPENDYSGILKPIDIESTCAARRMCSATEEASR